MTHDYNITVSVVCMVYNHAPFLRECLDGFVSQRTDFSYEVIVHDDCSTDESAAIIKEYARKYPEIIRPILQKENQYSKHDGSLRRAVEPHIRGKYVAICEGDDYWTDPDKLQTQVKFMESHPDAALCFHNVEVLYGNKKFNNNKLYSHLHDGEFSASEIITQWTVPTCSALLPAEHYLSVPYDSKFAVGDNVMWLHCCTKGKVFCINKKMAVYRRMESGWTLDAYGGSKQKVLASYEKYVTHLDLLLHYFPNLADNAITRLKSVYLSRIFIIKLVFRQTDFVSTFKRGIQAAGVHFVSDIFKTGGKYISLRIRRCIGHRKTDQ